MTGTRRTGDSVFLSYARRDRPKVTHVVEGLQFLGKEVWLDESLTGGETWWNTILDRVRRCDVFVQCVSPAALDSEACNSERDYARALGKPVLPVLINAVSLDLLPPGLAELQVLEYTEPTPESAFRLARAVERCPPAPPLRTDLPAPPAVPVSYVGTLSKRVRAPALSLDEQLALVARLREAADRPDQREAALEVLHRLAERHDLYASAAREIERLQAVHLEIASSRVSADAMGGAGSAPEPKDDGIEAPRLAPRPSTEPPRCLYAVTFDGRVRDVAVSPNGERFATLTWPKTGVKSVIQIWDSDTGDELASVEHDTELRSVDFVPDGELIATDAEGAAVLLDSEGATTRLDVGTGERLEEATEGSLYMLAFSSDGRYVAAAATGASVRVCDRLTGDRLVHVTPAEEVFGLHFSPDGEQLLTRGARVHVWWDLETGRETSRESANHVPIPQGDVLARNSDGTRVATYKDDNTNAVWLWDLSSGREPVTIALGRGAIVWGVAFSPDGKRVAIAEHVGPVRIWSTDYGHELVRISQEAVDALSPEPDGSEYVDGLVFTPDGSRLVTITETARSRTRKYGWRGQKESRVWESCSFAAAWEPV